MTSIEFLGWWGMVAPGVVGLILGGIGAGLDEEGNKEASKVFLAFAMLCFGVVFISGIKWGILILDKVF